MVKDEIQFLKDLQLELRSQEKDCQAAPRFWVIGDYKMVDCAEGRQDTYHFGLPDKDYYGDMDGLLERIKEEWDENEFSGEAREKFEEIDGCPHALLDWVEAHYDSLAELIPMSKEHIVCKDTMFLTKAEAKRHLELNHYNYSPEAHTFAMTAWRSPEVERLYEILENFDWGRFNG